MELFKKVTGALIAASFCVACNNSGDPEISVPDAQESDTIFSTDFTNMGEFTEGIEGPAINSQGDLFVVNYQKQGTIGKVDKSGKVEIYLTLPEGSIGNSIQFDEQDVMYVADYNGHTIYKISTDKNIDTLVNHQLFNQPNDIALAYNKNIYATDPNWGNSNGNLWLVKDGKAILQEENMGTTNGVVLSLDEKTLFVNESVQRNVWSYKVNEDGSLSDKKLFHHFEDHGMDGMKIDPNGNLCIARYGAGVIAVLSPEGKLIDKYYLNGDHPTNLVFSKDGKTIFVTMQKRKGVEKITL